MMAEGVLYVFKGSFNWITAPQLAIRELECREIIIEYVNLEDADTKLRSSNLKHTSCSPTLVIGPDKVLTDPLEIVKYLCRCGSKRNARSSTGSCMDLARALYCSDLNPNFTAISSRNERDLQNRFQGKAVTYLRDRQMTLERLARTSSEYKNFYETKCSQNGILVSLLDNTASPEIKQRFFAHSKRHWENVIQFILVGLPSYLPEDGFVSGDEPGEVDFHLIAWLLRTVLALGGMPSAEGLRPLEKELGGKQLPKKIRLYWEAWTRRDSWKYQFRTSFR